MRSPNPRIYISIPSREGWSLTTALIIPLYIYCPTWFRHHLHAPTLAIQTRYGMLHVACTVRVTRFTTLWIVSNDTAQNYKRATSKRKAVLLASPCDVYKASRLNEIFPELVSYPLSNSTTRFSKSTGIVLSPYPPQYNTLLHCYSSSSITMHSTFLVALLAIAGTSILPSVAEPMPGNTLQQFEVRWFFLLTERASRISYATRCRPVNLCMWRLWLDEISSHWFSCFCSVRVSATLPVSCNCKYNDSRLNLPLRRQIVPTEKPPAEKPPAGKPWISAPLICTLKSIALV